MRKSAQAARDEETARACIFECVVGTIEGDDVFGVDHRRTIAAIVAAISAARAEGRATEPDRGAP